MREKIKIYRKGLNISLSSIALVILFFYLNILGFIPLDFYNYLILLLLIIVLISLYFSFHHIQRFGLIHSTPKPNNLKELFQINYGKGMFLGLAIGVLLLFEPFYLFLSIFSAECLYLFVNYCIFLYNK